MQIAGPATKGNTDTFKMELSSALLAELPGGGQEPLYGPTSRPAAETQSPYQHEQTGCPLEPWMQLDISCVGLGGDLVGSLFPLLT